MSHSRFGTLPVSIALHCHSEIWLSCASTARPAEISFNVGEILQRSRCYSVSEYLKSTENLID